ncbi:hypothetical protein GCM10027168_10990 [Streptomyces capparidis]
MFPFHESFAGEGPIDKKWKLTGAVRIKDWLRLVKAQKSQAGTALLDLPFSSDKGISVEFELAAHGGEKYDGSYGDGLSFYLIDGTGGNTTGPGAPGGALGYACQDAKTPGVNKGYIGIGLDQFGSFSLETHAGHGGTKERQPDHAVIRGSGHQYDRYCYIKGVALPKDLSLSQKNPARVHLSIIKGHVTVAVGNGSDRKVLISEQLPSPGKMGMDALPAELKLGLSASTGFATNNYDIRNLGVTLPADLYTELRVPESITNGKRLTYTATFGNNGPNAVEDGAVRIEVPKELTGVTCELTGQTGGGTWAPDKQGHTVTGTANLPAPKDKVVATITLTVSGTVPQGIADGTVLTGESKISSEKTADPKPDNNVCKRRTTVKYLDADLYTKLSAQQTVDAGGELTYYATFGNAGPHPVTDGTARIDTPRELTGVTAKVEKVTGGGRCVQGPTVSGGKVTGMVDLPAGATVVVKATGTVPEDTADGTRLTGTSDLRSRTTKDPNPGDNTDTRSTCVQVRTADLYTALSAPGTVDNGKPLTFTATFGNHGPNAVKDGAACLAVPAELVGVKPKMESSTGGGRCVTGPQLKGREVTAQLELPKGATVVISATGTMPKHVPDRTQLTGKSSISSAKVKDPKPGNNTATCTTAVRALVADLWTKLDAWPEHVAGSPLSCTAAFGNTGPQAVDDAQVCIDLAPQFTDADVRVVDTAGGGDFLSGPTLNRQKHQVTGLLKLPRGGRATVRVTGTIAEKTPEGTEAPFSSRIDSERTYDPAPQNNTDKRKTKVRARKPIAVKCTVLAREPKGGRWIYTYGLEVTYDGPLIKPAQDWVIHFRVPRGSEFLRANKPPKGLHTWNKAPEYGTAGDVAWVMSDGRSHPLPGKVTICVPVEVSHPVKDKKYDGLEGLRADALRVARKSAQLVTA